MFVLVLIVCVVCFVFIPVWLGWCFVFANFS